MKGLVSIGGWLILFTSNTAIMKRVDVTTGQVL